VDFATLTPAELKAMVSDLREEVDDLRDQLKRAKARGNGSAALDASTIEALELKAIIGYKLTKRVTPRDVDVVHGENQTTLREVGEVKGLLLRTLSDLKSRRKPEVKRRLEAKIKNLKVELHTMKEEKNNFVTDCNELSSVFEDKNKLEHKLSQFRRNMKKLLASADHSDDALARATSDARALIKEHDNMELVLERHQKKRNNATLEISKYLVEVACLLDNEVKLRAFEDLLDSWRDKYNIDEELADEPSFTEGDYYSEPYYSYSYPYYSDYGYYTDDYYSSYGYYSDEADADNADTGKAGGGKSKAAAADAEKDNEPSYSYSYSYSDSKEGDTSPAAANKDAGKGKRDESSSSSSSGSGSSKSGSGSSKSGSGSYSYSYSYSSKSGSGSSKSGSGSSKSGSGSSKSGSGSGSASPSYSYSTSGSSSGK
jgi:hypothetical protein